MTQKTIPELQADLREDATQLRRWYRHGSLSASGELMANDLEAAAEALGRNELSEESPLVSKAEALRIVEKVVCETWCGAEGQGTCDNCRAIAEIKAL